MVKMTLLTFCFVSLGNIWKTKIIIDFKLPCIFSTIFHRRHQNLVRMSVRKTWLWPCELFL